MIAKEYVDRKQCPGLDKDLSPPVKSLVKEQLYHTLNRENVSLKAQLSEVHNFSFDIDKLSTLLFAGAPIHSL